LSVLEILTGRLFKKRLLIWKDYSEEKGAMGMCSIESIERGELREAAREGDSVVDENEEVARAHVQSYYRCVETGLDWWKDYPDPKPQWLADEIAASIVQLYKAILTCPFYTDPEEWADIISTGFSAFLPAYPDLWPTIARALTRQNLHVWRCTLENYMFRKNGPIRTALEAPFYQEMSYRKYLETPIGQPCVWKSSRVSAIDARSVTPQAFSRSIIAPITGWGMNISTISRSSASPATSCFMSMASWCCYERMNNHGRTG
jgi:hypothetical protein